MLTAGGSEKQNQSWQSNLIRSLRVKLLVVYKKCPFFQKNLPVFFLWCKFTATLSFQRAVCLWSLMLSSRCFAGDYAGFPGCGLLRLHSTYRHDLKIYASDEGRVQMTAAAFAKVCSFLRAPNKIMSLLSPGVISLLQTGRTQSVVHYGI